jgi:hypothetical protein
MTVYVIITDEMTVDIRVYSVVFLIFMLSVVKLNVSMLSVVAPLYQLNVFVRLD